MSRGFPAERKGSRLVVANHGSTGAGAVVGGARRGTVRE